MEQYEHITLNKIPSDYRHQCTVYEGSRHKTALSCSIWPRHNLPMEYYQPELLIIHTISVTLVRHHSVEYFDGRQPRRHIFTFCNHNLMETLEVKLVYCSIYPYAIYPWQIKDSRRISVMCGFYICSKQKHSLIRYKDPQ